MKEVRIKDAESSPKYLKIKMQTYQKPGITQETPTEIEPKKSIWKWVLFIVALIVAVGAAVPSSRRAIRGGVENAEGLVKNESPASSVPEVSPEVAPEVTPEAPEVVTADEQVPEPANATEVIVVDEVSVDTNNTSAEEGHHKKKKEDSPP